MPSDFTPKPGISRSQRLCTEGLIRLQNQLQRQAGISDAVLYQWIKRYGKEAEKLILDSGRQLPSIDLD